MLSVTITPRKAEHHIHKPSSAETKNCQWGRVANVAVVQFVSDMTGVSCRKIMNKKRGRKPVAEARQLAMYLLHVTASRTMEEVGNFFHRDRTTVAYACSRVEDRRDHAHFEAMVSDLETAVSILMEIVEISGTAGPKER